MKPSPIPRRPDHASYRSHRRQVRAQILLPVLLGAAALVLAPIVAWLTAFDGAGDVGRWAAISTMWLLIPVMLGGMILLVVLIVFVVLAGRINGWIPGYSYRVQRVASRAAGGTRRAADMIRRPILAVRAMGSFARSRLQRLRERV